MKIFEFMKSTVEGETPYELRLHKDGDNWQIVEHNVLRGYDSDNKKYPTNLVRCSHIIAEKMIQHLAVLEDEDTLKKVIQEQQRLQKLVLELVKEQTKEIDKILKEQNSVQLITQKKGKKRMTEGTVGSSGTVSPKKGKRGRKKVFFEDGYSVSQAAEKLNVSKQAIYKAIREGTVIATRVNGASRS